jgi:hypothetical protein
MVDSISPVSGMFPFNMTVRSLLILVQVMRFDDGSSATLKEVAEWEEYVNQNANEAIRRRREIRMTLRALNKQIVFWPYEHIVVSFSDVVYRTNFTMIKATGSHFALCCRGRGYKATSTINFESCVLEIKPRGKLVWQDLQLGSGFEVQLIYSKDVKVNGEIIGLNEDWDLTTTLARFLAANQRLIPRKLEHVQDVFDSYRNHCIDECRAKAASLTYRFLTNVYDRPRDPTHIAKSTIEHERDPRVRQLMQGCKGILDVTYERWSVVSESEATTWWYIYWVCLTIKNMCEVDDLFWHRTIFGDATTTQFVP